MDDWKARRAKRQRDQNTDEGDIFSDLRGDAEHQQGGRGMTAAKRLRMERSEVLSSATGAKARRLMRLLESETAKKGHLDLPAEVGESSVANEDADTLLAAAEELRKKRDAVTGRDRIVLDQKEREARLLKEANTVSNAALVNAKEAAGGVVYTESMKTTWVPPRWIRDQGPVAWSATRDKFSIIVEGDDVPPPIQSFAAMKFPTPILEALEAKKIAMPTPIQMQGLPTALSGRDLVGIAFTGSGKTVTFSLPLVMAGLEEELRMPLIGGEGPIGVIMAPSRELARQTYDVVCAFSEALFKSGQFPELRTQLLIGGEDKREQLKVLQEKGVHAVVATPGRLKDFLSSKKMNFDICRYICLDEADRMLDLGFDEEVGEIMNHFKRQRQTLLFSATFPKKFQDFAKSTLVRPVVVNVGRAGAANLDVIQEVEYVKQESKIPYLLECLQKTAPPVCIFAQRTQAVDDIHEYLLLKGVEAVAIHGGKDQAERNDAIRLFKAGEKDVLIATDIAAKGLDFADIQHVVNFDVPDEIENYIHRIGRTGRAGKTGVASSFVNKSADETFLLDLKHLLVEAKQRVPPFLAVLEDPAAELGEIGGVVGCSFCGGLGHRVSDCPKLDKSARRIAGGKRDALKSGDGYGAEF